MLVCALQSETWALIFQFLRWLLWRQLCQHFHISRWAICFGVIAIDKMSSMLIPQPLQVAFRRLLDPRFWQSNSALAADSSLMLARISLPLLEVLEDIVAILIKLLNVQIFFFFVFSVLVGLVGT